LLSDREIAIFIALIEMVKYLLLLELMSLPFQKLLYK